MTPEQIERYKRHLLVKEIGGSGQKKLLNSHVMIVGAGALGGMAALSLAAAGVGRLTIYDDDRVDLSNLQRQIQFTADDVDDTKVGALFRRLSRLNHDVDVNPVQERWTPEAGFGDADLVLDGSDNFPTRFALNAATREANLALVSGAVAGWTGQTLVVNKPGDAYCPCYQCFVPSEPPQAGDCNDLGVLGAITQLIASQMSLAAIRLLLTPDADIFGRLMVFEGLSMQSRVVRLPQDPDCPICKS
ncbi:MAG: molybdopterin biosynthesis protein MoeB [Ponticaulis sp.]|nr:molybdopterin biosynthesis protein MoeB [Ponticaulis sp.]